MNGTKKLKSNLRWNYPPPKMQWIRNGFSFFCCSVKDQVRLNESHKKWPRMKNDGKCGRWIMPGLSCEHKKKDRSRKGKMLKHTDENRDEPFFIHHFTKERNRVFRQKGDAHEAISGCICSCTNAIVFMQNTKHKKHEIRVSFGWTKLHLCCNASIA